MIPIWISQHLSPRMCVAADTATSPVARALHPAGTGTNPARAGFPDRQGGQRLPNRVVRSRQNTQTNPFATLSNAESIQLSCNKPSAGPKVGAQPGSRHRPPALHGQSDTSSRASGCRKAHLRTDGFLPNYTNKPNREPRLQIRGFGTATQPARRTLATAACAFHIPAAPIGWRRHARPCRFSTSTRAQPVRHSLPPRTIAR
jgi:hypothetical protein